MSERKEVHFRSPHVKKTTRYPSWCMICGEEKNPIIKIHIEFFTFYLCLRHASMLYEELRDRLDARRQIEKIRAWAKRKGYDD